MSATQQCKSLPVRLLTSFAILCLIAALAGCGGSSSNGPTAQAGQQTPLQSNPDVRGHARASQIVQTGHSAQKARATPGTSKDDVHQASSSVINPCKLVRLSEAQAITGGAVTSQVEAPLGPTCIYRRSDSKSEITLTIESLSLARVTRQISTPTPLSVGNRHGYCGRLGAQMLFVPLAGGQLLQITAPCAIAQQFAVRALSRITA